MVHWTLKQEIQIQIHAYWIKKKKQQKKQCVLHRPFHSLFCFFFFLYRSGYNSLLKMVIARDRSTSVMRELPVHNNSGTVVSRRQWSAITNFNPFFHPQVNAGPRVRPIIISYNNLFSFVFFSV
jgi:hypothetical protein